MEDWPARFEKEDAEQVRLKIANDGYNQQMRAAAIAWLVAKDAQSRERSTALERRRDVIDRAIAISALIMATIAAISGIVAVIPVVKHWPR